MSTHHLPPQMRKLQLTQDAPSVVVASLCAGLETPSDDRITIRGLAPHTFAHYAETALVQMGGDFLLVVVSLRPGTHSAQLVVACPSGTAYGSESIEMKFTEQDHTWKGTFPVPPLERQGVHWFNVVIDEHVKARVPLRVIVIPPPSTSTN